MRDRTGQKHVKIDTSGTTTPVLGQPELRQWWSEINAILCVFSLGQCQQIPEFSSQSVVYKCESSTYLGYYYTRGNCDATLVFQSKSPRLFRELYVN